MPLFDERVSIADDHQSETFKPGEKELLYKVIFELRKELDEIKQMVGMNGGTPQHTAAASPRALPAPNYTAGTQGYTAGTTSYPSGATGYSAPVAPSGPTIETEAEEQEVVELKTLEKMERDAIEASMRRHNGLKKKVAEELGISERTLYRKINDYNLDHEFKN
jgi:DNA-binding NtrC family response regulator